MGFDGVIQSQNMGIWSRVPGNIGKSIRMTVVVL